MNKVYNGLTYDKGASWFRQLYKVLGRETFLSLCQKYLSKFAYKSVTYDDFHALIDEINPSTPFGSDFNVHHFMDSWL